MRSIRRSMTVYLLLLLSVTLGSAGWVLHDRTQASLEAQARAADEFVTAREAASAARLQTRYEDRCREERERVDQALRLEARGLADVMQREYFLRFDAQWKLYRERFALIQAGFGNNPLAQTVWAWAGNSVAAVTRDPTGLTGALFRSYFANLPIPEDCLQQIDAPDERKDFYQINTGGGRAWHSQSLDGRTMPFDPRAAGLEPKALYAEEASDALLVPSGERVRRVVVRMPLFNSTQPAQPGGRPGTGRPTGTQGGAPRGPAGWPPLSPPVPPPPSPDALPRIYIQVARPQAELEAAFARFAADRDAEMARSVADIRADRDRNLGLIRREQRRLEAVVVATGVAAFLALAVGGPLLIGRAFHPVGRFSVAVSEVSEKDFTLPHDGTDLPAELAPVHARLTQTLDLLRRAFAREKQSVADISHELRTPIASLLATIDVTLRKPRSPDQYRASLEECRVIAKQLGQLVERIMTLATLDAGTARTVAVRTDGADLAAGCAAIIRPLAEAHGLTLDVDAAGPLDLDTDPDKLREVLMNLLHNAVEYNQPGGTISLAVRGEDDRAVFEVRDAGIGMPPEVREKIFERFYRADPSRASTGVHAGLGLAIVKEYVGRLGGTIEVATEPGAGTTFRVSLPAAPAEEADDDEPVTPARPHRERPLRTTA